MPKRKLTLAELTERVAAARNKGRSGDPDAALAGLLVDLYGLPEIDEPESVSIGYAVAVACIGNNPGLGTMTIHSASDSSFINLSRVGAANPGEDLAHLRRIVASLVDEGIREHVAQGTK